MDHVRSNFDLTNQKNTDMNRKLKLLTLCLLCVFTLSAYGQKGEFRLVEIVVVKEGITQQHVNNYFELISPYLVKYGIKEVAKFKVMKKMRGVSPDNALEVAIWSIPDFSVFEKISQDKGYLQIALYRDLIFDFSKMTSFMTTVESEGEFSANGFVLPDFITLAKGATAKGNNDYFETLEDIGKDYNFKRVAEYKVQKFMFGQGPKNATSINFWEIDNPENLGKLFSDKKYLKKLEPQKEDLFEMNEVSVYMAKKN